jgi:hypothetical protein
MDKYLLEQLDAANVIIGKTIEKIEFPMLDRMIITFSDKTHTIISVDTINALDEVYALNIINFNIKE